MENFRIVDSYRRIDNEVKKDSRSIISSTGREYELLEGFSFHGASSSDIIFIMEVNEKGYKDFIGYTFGANNHNIIKYCSEIIEEYENKDKPKIPQTLGATLLSIEEAEKLPQRLRGYNDWWWTRSPGYGQRYAASVVDNGSIDNYGLNVGDDAECVRPALLINLKASNLKIGDIFNFGGKEFEIISNSLAFCLSDIGTYCFRTDWEAKDANDYKASDVKNFVDEWFEEAVEAEVQNSSRLKYQIWALGYDENFQRTETEKILGNFKTAEEATAKAETFKDVLDVFPDGCKEYSFEIIVIPVQGKHDFFTCTTNDCLYSKHIF